MKVSCLNTIGGQKYAEQLEQDLRAQAFQLERITLGMYSDWALRRQEEAGAMLEIANMIKSAISEFR